MPKKSQTARKSNKKQSKLSSFLSKLNPKTTKAKLVAFIVVFGLIGGGYYVYDTYASNIIAVGGSRHFKASQLEGGKPIRVSNFAKNVVVERQPDVRGRAIETPWFTWGQSRWATVCINYRSLRVANAPIHLDIYITSGRDSSFVHRANTKQIRSGWTATNVEMSRIRISNNAAQKIAVGNYNNAMYGVREVRVIPGSNQRC